MIDIYEHIRKAKEQAFKDNIKANMIIIDKDLARINNLYFPESETSYKIIPPMIMGLEVKYDKNLSRDYGINFVIFEGNITQNELEKLRQENEELRQKIKALKEVLGNEA